MQDALPLPLPPGVPVDATPSIAPHPWRDDPPLEHRDYQSGRHGYLAEGRVEPCDRRKMVRHLAKHPWTEGVYVPGAEGLARPEDVPGLLDEYRAQAVHLAIRGALWTGLFTAASAGALVWTMVRWDFGIRSLPGVLTVFATASLVLALHGIRQARRTQVEVFARARAAHRHWEWAKGHEALVMWALVVPLGLVVLLMGFDEEAAFARAGLVKPAVWNGEVWRMLTGPMLHAGFYHFWMNASGVYVLGKMVEAHTTPYHLPAVFLPSVLGGSLLSLLLSPTTSVGASGGVMGLVGFLWMMARLRPEEVPEDFGERMNYAIGATALLGVIGIEFIDNWAHLGGLLAGGGMGWLLLRGGAWERRNSAPIAVAGPLSLVVLLGAMFLALVAAWGTFGG